MEQFEEKKVTDLTINELANELAFCDDMKSHYYARFNEVLQELKRRYKDGRNNVN